MPAAMNDLVPNTPHPEDHQAIMTEIESNFWQTFEKDQQIRQDKAREERHKACREVNEELSRLNRWRSQLSRKKEVLLKELAAVDGDLLVVTQEQQSQKAKLDDVEYSYRSKDAKRVALKHDIADKMTKWFRQNRMEKARVGDEPQPPMTAEIHSANSTRSVSAVKHPEAGWTTDLRRPDISYGERVVSDREDFTSINNEDSPLPHNTLPPLQSTQQVLRQVPQQGTQQESQQGHSPVVVDEKPSPQPPSQQSRLPPHEAFARLPKEPSVVLQGPGALITPPVEPETLPGFKLASRDQAPAHSKQSLSTSPRAPQSPALATAPPSRHNALRTHSPPPRQQSPHVPTETDPSADITKENLILRHDGRVYTYPPCVAGVPVEKITESHPYWNPAWPDVRTSIETQLHSFQVKANAVDKLEARTGVKDPNRFSIRQPVKRGLAIMHFLDNGDISPFQLLNKSFYSQTSRGTITTFDTLFRLCDTVNELVKYNLSVTPVDWLRQRLHEIIQMEGAAFNFAQTIKNFYNDEKLASLRQRNGGKRVGRPLGRANKRKAYTPVTTPHRSPVFNESPSFGRNYHHESPPNTHRSKRYKPMSPAGTTHHDEADGNGVETDTDSYSGGRVGPDDFRIYQVKSRLHTSSQNVTQYWTWNDDGQQFDHQVLVDTDPVEWNSYDESINFHVNVEDVSEIMYSKRGLHMKLVMHESTPSIKDGQPRGDIMAAFKRRTTLRRFLAWCRTLKIPLSEEPEGELERLWAEMRSEQLPCEEDVGTTTQQESHPRPADSPWSHRIILNHAEE